MTAPSDPRAVAEYRVPAVDLKVGDLVNTSPGEGDWQQVIGVYRSGRPTRREHRPHEARRVARRPLRGGPADRPAPGRRRHLLRRRRRRWSPATTRATTCRSTDAASGEDGERAYLYTKFELVTVRPGDRLTPRSRAIWGASSALVTWRGCP